MTAIIVQHHVGGRIYQHGIPCPQYRRNKGSDTCGLMYDLYRMYRFGEVGDVCSVISSVLERGKSYLRFTLRSGSVGAWTSGFEIIVKCGSYI